MKIRELLSDESKWTKGADARDCDGTPAHPYSEKAVCWSLVGAIQKCYGPILPLNKIYNKILLSLGLEHLVGGGSTNVNRWCFARTFAEVKELVERLDI